MKNKNVYAFDLANSCKNCIRWQDIGRTQEVKPDFSMLPAVVFKVGRCTDGSYTTEKYGCENFKQKEGLNMKTHTHKLGFYILSGVILFNALIIITLLSIRH